MRSTNLLGALLAAGLVMATSCEFATDVELTEIAGSGVIVGQAYLDLNGNGTADASDLPVIEGSVELTTGSGDVVLDATTDSSGVFLFAAVPVGTYQLGLGSAVLGDSLEVVASTSNVTVELGDTAAFTLGATYPTLTLDELRTATAGRRVFSHGVALNARLASTDGTVHLIDTSTTTYIRATSVSLPTANVLIGDSVRLLGTTAVDNGQPTLSTVTPVVLQRGLSVPPPIELSTQEAGTADGGTLDAGLARVRLAEISDTSTAPNGDFHFWLDDGSDSVEVVFKWFRGISSSGIRPDTVVRINQASGLLTPYDDGISPVRWRLLPRAASEVLLETKRADVAVTTTYLPDAASTGDTVSIRVTVRNLLPDATHTATGVTVSDTIPAGLTFLSATATSGSYDDATSLWTVGDLAPDMADTLEISAEVTGGAGTIINSATFNGLTFEVETDGANDAASDTLTIS